MRIARPASVLNRNKTHTTAYNFITISLHKPLRPQQAHHVQRHFSTTAPTSPGPLTQINEQSSLNPALIFHSTSTNPYRNLAIEHFLLTHSDPSSHVLYFYTNRPCVVIGRNQNPWLECDLKRLFPSDPAANSTHTTHQAIDLVRRRSGGGTVFHDTGNLNYSVIIPNDKAFTRSKHAEMVVRALQSIPDGRFGEVKVNERNDIVMLRRGKWLKVSGSAFKLTKGRALHHGTLLYSSPNLDRISGLLRSPGRDFITAKGVESVRSAVGNLSFTEDESERGKIREEIKGRIVEEFWRLYGDGRERAEGLERWVGDEDEEIDEKVKRGLEELLTDDWRFGQTPRFEFRSGSVDGVEVKFHVNRGVLERVWFSDGEKRVESEGVPADMNIYEVRNWAGYLSEIRAGAVSAGQRTHNTQLPEALIQRIESVFPYMSSRK